MKFEEIQDLYNNSFFKLVQRARNVHIEHWLNNKMQKCTLLSIKTGGCSEDCSYCSQSSRYNTEIDKAPLMKTDDILAHAKQAKENGAERFCMGAAWKGLKKGSSRFNNIIDIVKGVSKLDMEVCATLGEIGDEEAKELKNAGLDVYNHNVDTSEDHYGKVVTSHTFEDRVKTIKAVQKSGMKLCCGGILGLGESLEDRLKMIAFLSELEPHPESVPINILMPMAGTPFENNKPIDIFELVRVIAVCRIVLPKTKVRLSAGRKKLSKEGQAWCFYAGANSIFFGNKLLTAKNPSLDEDNELLHQLDLV